MPERALPNRAREPRKARARGTHRGSIRAGKVHYVGALPELEDQLCNFLPEGNEMPVDRVDALVWGASFLMPKGVSGAAVTEVPAA